MSRCHIHIIPEDAFNTYDETGNLTGEYSLNDCIRSDEEITATVKKHIESDKKLERGDLICFGSVGEDRDQYTFVWNGVKAVHFDGLPEIDYPGYPIDAGISIDEFSTVDYYQEADFYNKYVLLNLTGYELTAMDLKTGKLSNATKNKNYYVSVVNATEDSIIEVWVKLQLKYPILCPFNVDECYDYYSPLLIKDNKL